MRKIDLLSYWMPILKQIPEFKELAKAEEPELHYILKALDNTLKNMYISTADEYGIAKFEKYLGLMPSEKDTLEERRGRVQTWWFMLLPYTWRKFLEKLIAICGDQFTAKQYPDEYRVELETYLEIPGQVEELEKVIEAMLPCNMILSATNHIICIAEGKALIAAGVCTTESFYLTNDNQENIIVKGNTNMGIGIMASTEVTIIEGMEEQGKIDENPIFYSGYVTAQTINIEGA